MEPPNTSINPAASQLYRLPTAQSAFGVSMGDAKGPMNIPSDCRISPILRPNMILR